MEENKKNQKSEYSLLYKLGGIAPIITIVLYFGELIFIDWSIYPENVQGWFELFGRSKFLGLFYLNSLDIISIALLGIMFAALCVRLKEESKSLTAIALPFAFLGIGVFLVPRTLLLSFITLSNEYSSGLAETNTLMAAGKTLSVIGVPTIQTAGFFIVSFAAFLLSIVMINSSRMPKMAGFIGIMAFFLTLADDIFVLALPMLATPLLVIAGFFWVAWWIIVSVGLLKAK